MHIGGLITCLTTFVLLALLKAGFDPYWLILSGILISGINGFWFGMKMK